MASAPPMEAAGPQPPSYEEAMSGPYPHGFVPPPTAFNKPAQPPYPYQPYVPPVASPPVSVHTVYVHQAIGFGDRSMQVQCPTCTQMVMTRLDHTSGVAAWLTCAGLFIIGCIYGCCLIPFCVDGLKDVTHHCPNCCTVLGVYKRLG